MEFWFGTRFPRRTSPGPQVREPEIRYNPHTVRWTLLIISIYALASLCAFLAYWIDKRRAGAGRRRLRERTLHLWSLAGGWPGAAVARRRFRHKTRDRKFLAVEWLIAALHLGVWAAALWLWLTRSG